MAGQAIVLPPQTAGERAFNSVHDFAGHHRHSLLVGAGALYAAGQKPAALALGALGLFGELVAATNHGWNTTFDDSGW